VLMIPASTIKCALGLFLVDLEDYGYES